MSQEVRVPDMGDVPEAEVIEVFVRPGQSVAAGEPLLTLESDKAAMDLPSPFAGVVEAVHVQVDDRVRRDTLVATLTDAPAAAAALAAAAAPAAESAPAPAPAPAPAEEPAAVPGLAAAAPAAPAVSAARPGALPHAGPAVRRFARDLGVDLSGVEGRGRRGRITREDVEQHVRAVMARRQQAGAAPAPAGPPADAERFGPTRTEDLTRIQRRSGANLQRNWQLAPHVTQHCEADITELERRRRARPERPTLTACALAACARALAEHPRVNACLSEDGRRLLLREYVHIGFAVDTPDGLLVPVIRDADRSSIAELAAAVGDLAARARSRQLAAEDMQGGGFTLSNLGGAGGGYFTPVINLPQVAVLGLGRAAERLLWIDGAAAPRLLLPLSLSYDHRVLDGVAGARFAAAVAAALEAPDELPWEAV